MMIRSMISRKWILTTLLVLAAMAVMIRLGIWQLDRLEKRRLFNSRVSAQIAQPMLEITGTALNADLTQMEYRTAGVTGIYDLGGEVALRNQYWQDQWGVHLITPLLISGSKEAILVDRGWIPGDDYQSGDWSKYAEPGQVTVHGVIRLAQSQAELGRRADPTPRPGETSLKTWNFVNIPRLANQVDEPLLPVYIQQAPDPGWTGMPYRTQPDLDLSEGPHLGYAFQWFIFTAILGIGYPFFIRRQEREKTKIATVTNPTQSNTQDFRRKEV